ncbi:MAG: HPr-rel-A system PqqD family peptide chaperone [Allosphingosinicella sp.]
MSEPRFVADPEGDVTTVELDGLALLFHRPSGMTHFVAPPAPQILAALQLGPANSAELLGRLRAWYDFEVDENVDALEARIAELEAAGLVSRL